MARGRGWDDPGPTVRTMGVGANGRRTIDALDSGASACDAVRGPGGLMGRRPHGGEGQAPARPGCTTDCTTDGAIGSAT